MWIKVTTTEKEKAKHLINVDKIMDINYSEETDLSIITFDRSAYPSLYIRGNIMSELAKLIASEGGSVATITSKNE